MHGTLLISKRGKEKLKSLKQICYFGKYKAWLENDAELNKYLGHCFTEPTGAG